MLKYFLYILLAAAAIGLAAGGFHLYRVAQKNKKEMAPYMKGEIRVDRRFGKVLVVYYSLSGQTRKIADIIREKTGADVYEIKTVEKIDTTPWFYLTLRKQLKTGKYPNISENLPDFAKYDIIFVGSPIWWYTAATPVLSFLEKADFHGRKVVPFSTQGSNYGTFFEDFAAKAQNAQILKGQSFNNLPAEYDHAVDNKISVWLNKL